MRLIVLAFLMLSLSLSAQTGYNAYALDKLELSEAVALGEIVPKGLKYRLGGNEYKGREFSSDFKYVLHSFLETADAMGVSAVVPNSGLDLDQFDHLTFGNEEWDESKNDYIRPWDNIWLWWLNREKVYRDAAEQYAKDAQAYSEQIGREVYLNVPLPQNRFQRAFLREVRKHYNGTVSIHVYGKTGEGDYLRKLDGWLKEVTYLFDDVFVGEFNGSFLHKERDQKNGAKQAYLHREILKLFDKYGITEVYYFTLCAPESALNWKNPPIYYKWLVGNQIVDSEPNVK